MNDPMDDSRNKLPRYGSEVEHYIAMHGGDPLNIDNATLVDAFWAGMTVEECGKKVIAYQTEQEKLKHPQQQNEPN